MKIRNCAEHPDTLITAASSHYMKHGNP